MRKKLGKWVLPVAAAGMLVLAIFHVVKAQQTPFGKTVAGAGIVEARSQNISLGTALPGVVLEVYGPQKPGMQPWDSLVGETVRKGAKLFLVDNRQLAAQLKYYEANLVSAQAQLKKLQKQPRPEEIPSSQAKVDTAQANLELQKDLAERGQRLIGTRAMSEEDYRQRVLATEVARQQLKQAKADLALLKAGAWEYDINITKAAVKLAEAQIGQTQADLDRLLVRAPVDGVVLQVNVRPGEYVGTPPGQALIVLGATDKTVHVRVDIDEHDIARFKKDAPARASVRGTPQIKYPLKYVRTEPYVIPKKSLTGDNTERVDTRVLQVIYALDVTDKPIYVGQQLDVFIDVGQLPPSLRQ